MGTKLGINRGNTIALIVDYQEKLMPVMYEKEKLLDNSVKLINGLRILGIPMIVTQQYTKGIGMTVPEIVEACQIIEYIDKKSFSCYGNKEVMDKVIRMRGIENVILCGIEAHICVLQTAIDLQEAGFKSVLAEDCISSRKPNDKLVAIGRAEREGAVITTYESVLFELMKSAEVAEFKQISKLIK